MKTPRTDQLQHILSNQQLSETEALARIRELVAAQEKELLHAQASVPATALTADYLSMLENTTPTAGEPVFTGLELLDKMTSGFMPGEFVVIGGRPGIGKTSLLVQLVAHMASHVPVLFFSFDNSQYLLTRKLLSHYTEIPLQKILTETPKDNDLYNIKEAVKQVNELKLLVNDSCSYSMEGFRWLCEKHVKEDGVRVVVIDYLQLMRLPNFRNNRDAEVSYICRELKSIAKELGVSVICTSQLSRAVETRGGDKRPMLSDLRDSGSIEQDADKVMFVYRPEYYGITEDMEGNSTLGQMEVLLVKNRTGTTDAIKLSINQAFSKFETIDPNVDIFHISEKRLNELDESEPF